jgi:hypothetical protein
VCHSCSLGTNLEVVPRNISVHMMMLLLRQLMHIASAAPRAPGAPGGETVAAAWPADPLLDTAGRLWTFSGYHSTPAGECRRWWHYHFVRSSVRFHLLSVIESYGSSI